MGTASEADRNISVFAPESLAQNVLNLSEPGLKTLAQLIADTDADVLVVDTWRLLPGPVDEKQTRTCNEWTAFALSSALLYTTATARHWFDPPPSEAAERQPRPESA